MFARSAFHRQFAVLAAALLVSSVAIGSAVGPGASSTVAHPLVNVIYA